MNVSHLQQIQSFTQLQRLERLFIDLKITRKSDNFNNWNKEKGEALCIYF